VWGWVGLETLQAGDPRRVGPYALLGRLGAGGMGQVYLGRSPGGRLVAVKVIRGELAADPGFRARFAREVAAARGVSGVFTAPVVDADLTASVPWLATGFVKGPSLAQAVDDHGPMPVRSVLALAAGLAEGLGAIHAAGVVHRDLKPSNVLLAPDGPRVIDFGISQAADDTHLTRTGTVIGSPGFMSPEQVIGGHIGPASDVFSLGSVLVFAATGEGPFGTGTATSQLYRVVYGTPQLDRVPDPVRPLVVRCMAREPGQRPSAGQFLAELTAAYPAAADLSDWLPASVLQEAAPSGAARGAGPTADVAGSATWPPAAAPAGPLASDAAEAWTLTSAVNSAASTGPDRPVAEPVSPVIPARPPVGAGQAGGTRRPRWLVPVIAAVAVAGAVIGLVVAAPWKSPAPVLQPTGLAADSSSASSVAFHWSGPATGPAPDEYQITQDGHVIGSVPGSITYYRDAGLAPDTSYQFQVTAIRNGKDSPQSSVLSVTTLTPPLAAAVLTGQWSAHYHVTSLSNFTWSGTKTWSEGWTFSPVCGSGACNVTLNGAFGGSNFTSTLARTGSTYSGTAPLNNWATCNSSHKHAPSTLVIQIQVQHAGVTGTTWQASAWGGTVTVDVHSSPGCSSSTVNTTVSSS
jgi:hypothetical protein